MLQYLALEARKARDPGSHGTGTIRETVLGRLPAQSPAQTAEKHTLKLSVKEAYLLAQGLWSEGQPSTLAHD